MKTILGGTLLVLLFSASALLARPTPPPPSPVHMLNLPQSVAALDARNGKVLWTRHLAEDGRQAPAYVLAGRSVVLYDGEASRLEKLNIETGRLEWEDPRPPRHLEVLTQYEGVVLLAERDVAKGDLSISLLAAVDGKVERVLTFPRGDRDPFVRSLQGYFAVWPGDIHDSVQVYHVKQPQKLWSAAAQDVFLANPGRLGLEAQDGLTIVDAATGTVQGTAPLAEAHRLFGAFEPHTLYYIASGELHALDLGSYRDTWHATLLRAPRNPRPLRFMGRTPESLLFLVPETRRDALLAIETGTGKTAWKMALSLSSKDRYTMDASTLYVQQANRLAAIDAKTGAARWYVAVSKDLYSVAPGPGYLCLVEPAGGSYIARALDPPTGHQLWKWALKGP